MTSDRDHENVMALCSQRGDLYGLISFLPEFICKDQQVEESHHCPL